MNSSVYAMAQSEKTICREWPFFSQRTRTVLYDLSRMFLVKQSVNSVLHVDEKFSLITLSNLTIETDSSKSCTFFDFVVSKNWSAFDPVIFLAGRSPVDNLEWIGEIFHFKNWLKVYEQVLDPRPPAHIHNDPISLLVPVCLSSFSW